MAAPPARGVGTDEKGVQNFKVLKSLGEGSYGKVYKVQRTTDDQCYALKETDMAKMKHSERMDAVNEIRLLVSISHPNVIRYHEAFLNGTKLCVIMEYAPFGDLRYYITKANRLRSPFPEEAIWRIFLQLAKGLSALHAKHIIHRDIKPANIFLCANDLLKIGDLGVSKALTTLQFTRTSIGTPVYMAPEVWVERPYSYSSDMWSVGCVLYEMMTFNTPFNGRSMPELSMRVRSGRFTPIRPGTYSQALIDFTHSLLSLDPKKRPTANEILSHAACAKWMHILPTPPTSRRQSESGAAIPAYGQTPSSLLDTIMVPRDLRHLPRVLPPASYDSDTDSQVSDQPSKSNLPSPVVRPSPAAATPNPRAMQDRRSPSPAARPQLAPIPAFQPPSRAASPGLPNVSPRGAGLPLLNNRPPLPRFSDNGAAGLPAALYGQRPHSAVYNHRSPGMIPPLPPVRVSADGSNFPGRQQPALGPPMVRRERRVTVQ